MRAARQNERALTRERLMHRAPWGDIPFGAPLYRERDLRQEFGLSTTRIYEMMASGTFPRPVKIGPRAVAWCKAHVDAWLNDRAGRMEAQTNRRRKLQW